MPTNENFIVLNAIGKFWQKQTNKQTNTTTTTTTTTKLVFIDWFLLSSPSSTYTHCFSLTGDKLFQTVPDIWFNH